MAVGNWVRIFCRVFFFYHEKSLACARTSWDLLGLGVDKIGFFFGLGNTCYVRLYIEFF